MPIEPAHPDASRQRLAISGSPSPLASGSCARFEQMAPSLAGAIGDSARHQPTSPLLLETPQQPSTWGNTPPIGENCKKSSKIRQNPFQTTFPMTPCSGLMQFRAHAVLQPHCGMQRLSTGLLSASSHRPIPNRLCRKALNRENMRNVQPIGGKYSVAPVERRHISCGTVNNTLLLAFKTPG